MEIQVVFVAIASFLGAVVVALLGWADSQEPFNAKKFLASALRGLVAAVAFAVGVSTINSVVSWPFYLGAFLGGAGLDVVGKKAQDVLAKPPTS